eukprot:415414-Prorocentrum_minimum.AAC.9
MRLIGHVYLKLAHHSLQYLRGGEQPWLNVPLPEKVLLLLVPKRLQVVRKLFASCSQARIQAPRGRIRAPRGCTQGPVLRLLRITCYGPPPG